MLLHYSMPRVFGPGVVLAGAAITAVVACSVLLATSLLQRDVAERDAVLGTVVAGALPPAGPSAQAIAPFAIGSVSTAHNRLVVSIVNEGGTPLTGDLVIRVNGDAPHAVPASALSVPGATASVTLDDVVVQRRAPVTVEVRTADGRVARGFAVVAPDEPNDLELTAARVDPDGVLVAAVRNRSPIPLRGNLVVAVRETAFPYTLLARTETMLNVAAGGFQEVRVGHVGAVNLGRAQVALSTDAIEDADLRNDVYRP